MRNFDKAVMYATYGRDMTQDDVYMRGAIWRRSSLSSFGKGKILWRVFKVTQAFGCSRRRISVPENSRI